MDIVYLLHAEDTKRYKIGTTSSTVERRLKELQTGCPFKLRPVKSVVGGLSQESKIHDKFKEYRKQGEWFEFNGHVKRKVMKYMDKFGDENCQEYLIELKGWKERLVEGFYEDVDCYRNNLETLLELALINLELGCFEESINNLEEYYFHVHGDIATFYGNIRPANFLYGKNNKGEKHDN